MHPLAQRVVREALARGAVIDALEHFDDLAALNAAAEQTRNVSVQHVCDVLDMPVIVGELDTRSGNPAVLYHLSWAAAEWMERCGRDWYPRRPVLQGLCSAWALAHANDPDMLRAAASPRVAAWAARKWASTLNCGLAALFAAVSDLLNEHKAPPQTDGNQNANRARKPGMRSALTRLCHEFGKDNDHWLFCPLFELQSALDFLRRKDAAEARAIARARKQVEARDPEDPDVLAFQRWREASDAFLKKMCPDENTGDNRSCPTES